MEVEIPAECAKTMKPEDLEALKAVLREDPRPAYQDDPERVYAFEFAGKNVRFVVEGKVLKVVLIQNSEFRIQN